MERMTLFIGNKNYSSWSLRPWLVLKHAGATFEEKLIPLDQPDTAARIAQVNPAGRVPALLHGDQVIWDSLAICEYANELFPKAQLWPQDAKARAWARSVSAEMHSGFQAMREHLPMKMKESIHLDRIPPEAQANIDRIRASWTELRRRHAAAGPYLFGGFSIADAMYAPVVSRFRTYGVPVDGVVAAYCETVWAHPAMQAWRSGAEAEMLRMARYDKA